MPVCIGVKTKQQQQKDTMFCSEKKYCTFILSIVTLPPPLSAPELTQCVSFTFIYFVDAICLFVFKEMNIFNTDISKLRYSL